MTDSTYNGWTNYETWAVGMWLDGNYSGEGTYRSTIEIVENAAWEGGMNHQRSHVADALKSWVRGENETEDASLAADLLGAAFDTVNWYELADAWIENVNEQATA